MRDMIGIARSDQAGTEQHDGHQDDAKHGQPRCKVRVSAEHSTRPAKIGLTRRRAASLSVAMVSVR